MKLFLVHTGYYDNNISNGFYESHTNYFVVADDIKKAKTKIKGIDEFKHKKMHIDGILEIQNIHAEVAQPDQCRMVQILIS